MLDEALDLMTSLWTGEPVRFEGKHYWPLAAMQLRVRRGPPRGGLAWQAKGCA